MTAQMTTQKSSWQTILHRHSHIKSRNIRIGSDRQAMMTFKPVGDVQGQQRCPSPEMTTSNVKQAMIVESRRVTFKEFVIIRPTLHISDYADVEVLNTWYSRMEMKRIKREISETIVHVHSMAYDGDDDHYCTRGIEVFCFREYALNRKANKLLGLKTVLDEQDHHEHLRIVNPEAMRLGYQRVIGNRCSDEARQRGTEDEFAMRGVFRVHEGDLGVGRSPWEHLRGAPSVIAAQ